MDSTTEAKVQLWKDNVTEADLKAELDGLLAGDEEKLKGLEDLLRAYGIKEIVRTGKIAMMRAPKK